MKCWIDEKSLQLWKSIVVVEKSEFSGILTIVFYLLAPYKIVAVI